MLARANQRERGGMVDRIRRHIGNGIEAVPRQRILKPCEAVVNVVVFRKSIDTHRRNVASRHNLHALDGLEGFRMVFRHAARSKNKKTHDVPQR